MCHEKILNEHEVLDKEKLSIHDRRSALDDCCSSLERFSGSVHDLIKYVSFFLLGL